jgi:hypothetical protein
MRKRATMKPCESWRFGVGPFFVVMRRDLAEDATGEREILAEGNAPSGYTNALDRG